MLCDARDISSSDCDKEAVLASARLSRKVWLFGKLLMADCCALGFVGWASDVVSGRQAPSSAPYNCGVQPCCLRAFIPAAPFARMSSSHSQLLLARQIHCARLVPSERLLPRSSYPFHVAPLIFLSTSPFVVLQRVGSTECVCCNLEWLQQHK